MNNTMKKIGLGILLAASATFIGCGRDITADAFQFGGVGDPDTLPPSAPDAGISFTLARMRTSISAVSLGANDLAIAVGIANTINAKGFGGALFLFEPPYPGNNNGSCYYNLGATPLLNDLIETIDIGNSVTLNNTSIVLTRDPDVLYTPAECGGPGEDFHSYFFVDLGDRLPFGQDVGLQWSGGVLPPEYQCGERTIDGFETGDPFFSANDLVRIPPELTSPDLANPTQIRVNGVEMDIDLDSNGQAEPLQVADEYVFDWDVQNGIAERVSFAIQFYGSTLSPPDPFTGAQVAQEAPFIQQYATIVCTANDTGQFTITKEMMDDFTNLFFTSPVVAGLAGEDANGNGIFDDPSNPLAGDPDSGVDPTVNEDLNGNGQMDPIVGAIIMAYRWNESAFTYRAKENKELDGVIKAIGIDYTKLDWNFGDDI